MQASMQARPVLPNSTTKEVEIHANLRLGCDASWTDRDSTCSALTEQNCQQARPVPPYFQPTSRPQVKSRLSRDPI